MKREERATALPARPEPGTAASDEGERVSSQHEHDFCESHADTMCEKGSSVWWVTRQVAFYRSK